MMEIFFLVDISSIGEKNEIIRDLKQATWVLLESCLHLQIFIQGSLVNCPSLQRLG